MRRYAGKKIAIIGASYLQLPLIQKANHLGLETHVFAWAANDVGESHAYRFHPISITEVDDILAVCREIGIDGICSIGSDLAMHCVNHVANELGLEGNSLECTRISTNKFLMREAFAKNNDPSPKYIQVTRGMSMEAVEIDFPAIVKPVDRSGSRGVSKVISKLNLADAIEAALDASFSDAAVVESFLSGQEYSVECLSFRGQHNLLSVTRKFTTGAPHFVEIGHMEPADLPNGVTAKEVEAVVFHALDSLGISSGASHAEIMIGGAGKSGIPDINIVEIGGRMGGDCIGSYLVPLVTGIDYVKAVIDVSLGYEPVLAPSLNTVACAAVKYLVPGEEGFLEDVSEDDECKLEYVQEIMCSSASMKDSSARPLCCVVSSSSNENIKSLFSTQSLIREVNR